MSEQDEDRWIEAALASVRSDDVTPPEVVARLDDRLGRLQAERPAPSRRRFGPLLAAAAGLVVIAGVGVPVVRHIAQETPSGSASTASGTAAGGSVAPRQQEGLPSLSTRTFATDARRVLAAGTSADAQRRHSPQGVAPPTCAAASSPAPGVRSAEVVRLDGRPALLQVLAAHHGRQVVQAVSCSTSRVLAHATLPVS